MSLPLRSLLRRRPSRTSPAGRPSLRRLAALAVGTVVASGLLVVPAATERPADAATVPLSGAYVGGGDLEGARAFGAWRGRPLQLVTEFVDGSSWSSIANPTWAADRWRGSGYVVAWSVPMLPASTGSIQTGATGAYDAQFRQLAQTLVSRGQGSSVVRLGWEMNGTWYRWSAVKDPAAFVAYWRKVVVAMRSVSGAAFQFEWAPNLGAGTQGFVLESAYPGDAYVDVIGVSAYDQSWAFSAAQDAERWNDMVTMKYGLDWRVSFANARGKRAALSEWGLSLRCDGRGGGDNPLYVQKVRDWAAAKGLYYESYFDRDMGSCERHEVNGGAFPNAAGAYRTAFGPQAAPAPTAPTTATAPTAPTTSTTSTTPATTLPSTVLRLSYYADRRQDRALEWMGLKSRVYLFVRPGVTATQVRFYLDDPTMSRAPRHTENSAPWDLVGGSAAGAIAFDPGVLTPGTHTLTVAVTTPTGVKVARASFLR